MATRNGKRAKTLITDIGPVRIEVPRDRDGTFAPAIVAKRQRRFGGVDNLVISLTAKGLSFFMPVYPGAPKEASTQPSSSL